VAVRLIEMQFKLVEGRHSLSPLAIHLLWATKMGAKMGLRLRGLISLLAATTLFAGVLANGVADAPASVQSQANALTEKNVETIALQWFEQMRTGQIDRTQLTAEYSAQLTDDAVKKMSAYLNEYRYGASPTGAQVLRTRTIGEQTFYDVKLTFPRGDAASLLFGLNVEGKITGIALMSMAGD
jgi:hypothetical protein